MSSLLFGDRIFQFLAALAILPRTILKNRMYRYHIRSFFQIILVQFILFFISFQLERGKELNDFCPPNRSDDLCRFFCIYPSLARMNTGIIASHYGANEHLPFIQCWIRFCIGPDQTFTVIAHI